MRTENQLQFESKRVGIDRMLNAVLYSYDNKYKRTNDDKIW